MDRGKNDMAGGLRRLILDVAYAIALLSRIPVPVDLSGASARGAAAAWAWPLAGALVAGIAGAVGLICAMAGLAPGLVAGAVLAVQMVLTGAMHEDGLADSADGLWGGWDRARRLEIMKDSRIGTYGVLALGLSLVLRWQALSLLVASGGLVAAVVTVALLSRAPMAVTMATLPAARSDGLGRSVGRPSFGVAAAGVALAVAGALLCVGALAVWASVAVMAVTLGAMAIARAKIGGQTGDILGAVQQLCEIAVLAMLASAIVTTGA